MAQQKTATLIGAKQLGEEIRLFRFRMTDNDLGFVGSQYIIVDSGIVIAGDKIAKRAYSILSIATKFSKNFSSQWGKLVTVPDRTSCTVFNREPN